MKKKCAVCMLVVLVFSIVLPLRFSIFDLRKLEAKNNIEQYRTSLALINNDFAEDYDSRIIVKTKYVIEDNDCLTKASGFGGLNVLQYRNAEQAQQAVEYYSSLDYVEYAQIDQKVTLDDINTTRKTIDVSDMKHLSWGSDLLGVDDYQDYLMEIYKTKDNLPTIYVAVIDTGIDTDNEFLQGKIAYDLGMSYYDSTLYKSGKSKYAFEDDNSHGTHVSGTIVDLTLDNIKIIPVKVLSDEGSGSLSGIVSALEYVLSLKQTGTNVVAINMSLGGYSYKIFSYEEKEIDVISQLYDNNVMTVVAAGNENYFTDYYSPANIEKALTISALEQNPKNETMPTITYFSNYGQHVDLCLPGKYILSCVPDISTYSDMYKTKDGNKYAVISGTSMATPHAAGLVALYATYYGQNYDVKVVEEQIKTNTYDFGDLGRDDCYGYGVPCMSLAINKDKISEKPTLNFGEVGKEYHFDDVLEIKIFDNSKKTNVNHKIYYTLDGSYPTLISHKEYDGSIEIKESTLLRFVIYSFDKDGKILGASQVYEVTYFKGAETKNVDGTGFEITKNGIVKKYTSGIRDIVLPEYINGIKVKKLASELFYGQNITSFVCEQDIQIENYPFKNCATLKYIKLASKEAPKIAYSCFELEELVLPNSSEIKEAFFSSAMLGYLYGSDTFRGCFNLKTIIAPNVKRIEKFAFAEQRNLETLDIDWEHITYLGKSAFSHCESLEIDVVLPDSIKMIDENTFQDSGIKSITAKRVNQIGAWAFSECENLEKIEFDKITEVQEYTFYKCEKLTWIDLTDVTKIGNSAFSFCENLKNIDSSNCVEFGDDAFSWCKSLQKIDLTSCEKLGAEAFKYCEVITEINLPETLTEIPDGCFEACKSLEKFDFADIKKIGREAFSNCNFKSINLSSCEELAESEQYGKITGGNFRSCKSLESVILGDKLTVIPKETFAFCGNLKQINLANIKVVGEKAFSYCRNLTELDLSNLEQIAADAIEKTNDDIKIILGENENLIASDDEILPNINAYYISKKYSGKFGTYLKIGYKNIYKDFDEEYNVFSKFKYHTITFKFDDKTIIGTVRVAENNKIPFPRTFEYGEYNYDIYAWKDSSNRLVNWWDGTFATGDAVYVMSTNRKTERLWTINFYYGYDFDGSGVINDQGDIFATYKISKNKDIEISISPKRIDNNEFVFKYWKCDGKLYYKNCLPKVTGDMDFYAVYQRAVKPIIKPFDGKLDTSTINKPYTQKDVVYKNSTLNGLNDFNLLNEKKYYIVCVN